MDAYCARVGKEAGSIRFLFDGDRIAPDSTPNDLGMEDEDEIDAMVEVCYFNPFPFSLLAVLRSAILRWGIVGVYPMNVLCGGQRGPIILALKSPS